MKVFKIALTLLVFQSTFAFGTELAIKDALGQSKIDQVKVEVREHDNSNHDYQVTILANGQKFVLTGGGMGFFAAMEMRRFILSAKKVTLSSGTPTYIESIE